MVLTDKLESRSQPFAVQRIAVLGIGLLGGSVGLALRQILPTVSIAAWSRNTQTSQTAVRLGAATRVAESLADACHDAELVIVATPVDCIAQHVLEALASAPESALITDVGSTKSAIVRTIDSHSDVRHRFVGSHPIAGGNQGGPEHARADLFLGRTVVVTPTEHTAPERLQATTELWKALGAAVQITTPEEHDQILAATSHLPHLVASTLASLLPAKALPFVGTGWRDTTRIAGGSPQMWSAICRENSVAIDQQLQAMIAALGALRTAVAAQQRDQIEQLLQRGRDNRLQSDKQA